MEIKNIIARQILDSRGWPTIECVLIVDNGIMTKACVPSGASVGKYEALELRDNDKNIYLGKSVFNAIENINKKIAPVLIGREPNFEKIDNLLIDLDGTENKSSLGANAILAVSMAVARAQAKNLNKNLYELIASVFGIKNFKMPKVMFNVLNGGLHADSGISFQEFMIMPMKDSFSENLHIAVVVYQNLKKILKKAGFSCSVGDEGGFAPKFQDLINKEKKALDFLVKAVDVSGFSLGKEVVFCLDTAASSFYNEKDHFYLVNNKKYNRNSLIKLYSDLLENYPIFSIEDALYEQDWQGWRFVTEEFGKKVQLVGDDIFVTNPKLIKKGIENNVANAVLIKLNQIGTVSETLKAIKLAKDFDYKTVVSHRSGETCDTFISDLVVGSGSEFFKSGAPCRGERVVKYNRLLEIDLGL